MPCEYVFDGTDTDGTKWHECVRHDELAPSPDAPCAGWRHPEAEVTQAQTTEPPATERPE